MGVIVQKYGGSSLADIEKLKKISEMIAAVKKQGFDIVVVVSAMGKTTNSLINMAKEISPNPSRREMDMLLSTGERTTMALLCIALNELRVEAISLTGSQAGIITNDRHNDARVIEVRPVRVQDELERGKVVVIGGFQGVSYKRDITTLGRGGSDTSAVALAAALNAEKVLNAQAVQFAKEAKISLYARSTFNPGKETIIKEVTKKELSGVRAIVYETDIVRVLVNNPSKIELAAHFLEEKQIAMKEFQFSALGKDSGYKSSFIISKKNIYDWEEVRDTFINKLKDDIYLNESFSTLSIIGEGFSRSNTVLLETLKLLRDNNIEYYGVGTTSFRISILVERDLLEKAVKVCHDYWINN
jgi:aspartate kinase